MRKKEKIVGTDESKEMSRRKPSPISVCEESMPRVVVFDSTQTQGSSKYFLFTTKGKDNVTLKIKYNIPVYESSIIHVDEESNVINQKDLFTKTNLNEFPPR